MLYDVVYSGPETRRYLVGHDGRAVPYELCLVSDKRITELSAARDVYMAGLGVRQDAPGASDIFDDELALRLCADAVRDPNTGEALAPLSAWRRFAPAVIADVVAHYGKLLASERPSREDLGRLIADVDALIDDIRSEPAAVYEDYRLAFSDKLETFYGKPPVLLSLRQVMFHAHYSNRLARERA